MNIIIGVSPDQLQVGDVILGEVKPDGLQFTWTRSWTVTTIPQQHGSLYIADIKNQAGETKANWAFVSSIKFFIDRPQCQTDKKHIDPYPSKCPLCAEPAYVSALSVSHKDEDKASACTARRA